jgi:hypothetical protein
MLIKYISILPITLYIIYIVIKYGVQKSISDSVYRLVKKYRWIFTVALVLTSLLMAGTYIYNQEEIKLDSILLLLAALGICYTASAPLFKKSTIINTWHVSGAISGYVLGYAFIVSVYKWDSLWFILPSLVTIGLLKYYFSNKRKLTEVYYKYEGAITNMPVKDHFVWWAEIIGLITIYLATIL